MRGKGARGERTGRRHLINVKPAARRQPHACVCGGAGSYLTGLSPYMLCMRASVTWSESPRATSPIEVS